MTATSPYQGRGSSGELRLPPDSSVRVGHIFLDLRQRRLHWLNPAAQDLHQAGVPFVPADLDRHPLQSLSGKPVAPADFPLVKVWRQQVPLEERFVLPGPKDPPWHVSWSASPLRGSDGRLLGVLATVSYGPPQPDWQQMAELAHDLGTPLQSLRTLCAILDRLPQADAELRRHLATVRASADRAVHIAMGLLDCSRGPAARTRHDGPAWFALEPFLRTLADEQAVAARRKGLVLITDLLAIRGCEVHTDRIRLGRILANLLNNAVRYTTKGRVELHASWRDDAAGRSLVLGVIDSGPGISQEEQESIFQPYERGRAGREGDSGGSGLGLAVVDRLVGELGFTLEVFSQFGHGSAFHLVVPPSMLRTAS
jgi:anti-sigma regulatory factor (Ser/Thr protein kinase)